jgi:hypothetical protein
MRKDGVVAEDGDQCTEGGRGIDGASRVPGMGITDLPQVDTEGGIPPKLGALDPGTLDGIHIIRITTQAEMIAFWHTLEDWLVAHPKVRPSALPRN